VVICTWLGSGKPIDAGSRGTAHLGRRGVRPLRRTAARSAIRMTAGEARVAVVRSRGRLESKCVHAGPRIPAQWRAANAQNDDVVRLVD
jgi:hypothetical protein